MKLNVLSPVDGSVVSSSTEISFGTVRLGQYCSTPAVISLQKTAENNILGVKMFLQDDGGLTGSKFGYYTQVGFTGGIDNTNLLTGVFQVDTNPGAWPAAGHTGVSVGVTGGNPVGLVWLDLQVGASGPIGTTQANYRFVYDFN